MIIDVFKDLLSAKEKKSLGYFETEKDCGRRQSSDDGESR